MQIKGPIKQCHDAVQVQCKMRIIEQSTQSKKIIFFPMLILDSRKKNILEIENLILYCVSQDKIETY